MAGNEDENQCKSVVWFVALVVLNGIIVWSHPDANTVGSGVDACASFWQSAGTASVGWLRPLCGLIASLVCAPVASVKSMINPWATGI